MKFSKKKLFIILLIFASIFAFLFIKPCNEIKSWGRESNYCSCRGLTVNVYNQLPVDGDSLDVCIGLVEDRWSE